MKKLFAALVCTIVFSAAIPAWALDLVMDKPRDWQAPPPEAAPNHRAMWRDMIVELARYGKARKKGFVVLVRDAVELTVKGQREADWDEVQDPDGAYFEKRHPLGLPFRSYINAIDGVVIDGMYCGPEAFGKPLSQTITAQRELDRVIAEERSRGVHRSALPEPMGPFSLDPETELRKAAEYRRQARKAERQRRVLYSIAAMRDAGRQVLTLEHCSDAKAAQAAFRDAARDKVLTYAYSGYDVLNRIPSGSPWGANAQPVETLNKAKNWLPVLRGDRFGSKDEWVSAMAATNQDVLLVDVAYRGTDGLGFADVLRLKYKELGARRLVLADLSLGKAYDWRWYWNRDWRVGDPAFLLMQDKDDPGSYVTAMDDPAWKELVGKTLAGIIDVGFDGVVFDDADTYLWFEELTPLR